MPGPTRAGFVAFIRAVMGITTTYLPDGSPDIDMSLAVSMAIVNPALACDGIPTADSAGVPLQTTADTMFTQAVYNLGGDNLINFAQDQPGYRFFQTLRKKFNIAGFVSGVVQSASDESTSTSLVVQEAAKNFTLANLQSLKTPYGRQYLAIAQTFGPTNWGMS